jgi:hypothetical protein
MGKIQPQVNLLLDPAAMMMHGTLANSKCPTALTRA